jgi:hypothetical protein
VNDGSYFTHTPAVGEQWIWGGRLDGFSLLGKNKTTSMTRTSFMLRKCFFAGMAALLVASTANAAVIIGMVVDPTTTAGANSNSTRLGPGTWHIFGLDTTAGSSGISSFDVTLTSTGNMAANNRAPATNYDSDDQGTAVPAGFNLLRQLLGNNSPVVNMTGALPVPPSADSSANVGVDYFPISGYGQTASSFATKYAKTVLGPTTGAAWGTYNDLDLTGPIATALNPTGQKWVLLGEGTYTGAIPTGVGVTTIYTNFQNSFQSQPPAGGTSFVNLSIPEPASIALFGLALVGGLGFLRRRS